MRVLFHSETPIANDFRQALREFDLQPFVKWTEVEQRNGLVVAGLNQWGELAPSLRNRTVLIGCEADERAVDMRLFFREGLYDALIMPVSMKYFVAKIEQAVIRLGQSHYNNLLRTIEILHQGSFSQKEAGILLTLLRCGENGATRKTLFDGVWNGVSVQNKTLDTHLFNLRSKLEPIGVSIIWDRKGLCWRIHSKNHKLIID